jgi:hypothetical protein
MDPEKARLNLDAATVPDSDEEEIAAETVAQVVEPTSEAKVEETTVVEDTARVPYSRFETVHDRAVKAETELALLKQQRETTPEPVVFTGDLPKKWAELYGDNEASREAYGLYKAGIKEEFSTLKSELIQEVRREEASQEAQAEKTAEEWATAISDFGAKSNRKFTDNDESALLDVMDELTPKNEQGEYMISPITYLKQAVELHDLRNQKADFTKKEAKRRAATLAGERGEGEPGAASNEGHFRPGGWDSWRNNPALRG